MIKNVLIFLALFFSCKQNSKRKTYRQAIEYWMDRKIIIPDLTTKYCGRDTTYPNLWSTEYKILHYVDSSGCTVCKLNLFDRRKYMKELEKISPNISCIFILGIKDFHNFEQLQHENFFSYPVIYDSKMQFDSLNHFPSDPFLQTFLLNKNNDVIAIGDPIKNKAVKKLYDDVIQKDMAIH